MNYDSWQIWSDYGQKLKFFAGTEMMLCISLLVEKEVCNIFICSCGGPMHRFRITLHSPANNNLGSRLVPSCEIHCCIFSLELMFAGTEAQFESGLVYLFEKGLWFIFYFSLYRRKELSCSPQFYIELGHIHTILQRCEVVRISNFYFFNYRFK